MIKFVNSVSIARFALRFRLFLLVFLSSFVLDRWPFLWSMLCATAIPVLRYRSSLFFSRKCSRASLAVCLAAARLPHLTLNHPAAGVQSF